MTLGDVLTQGFHYARTRRSLWLFGFLVGMTGGGSNGGPGGESSGGAAAHAGAAAMSAHGWTALIGVLLVAIVVMTFLRFIGEGALIEGIVRARQGGTMTTREGLRAGWAHWGVLLRIALLYLAAMAAGVALLVVPCVVAVRALGASGFLVVIPGLAVVLPALLTFYMLQAFAMRIAVLENRNALDALAKARLFLHGRLRHGLTVMVAAVIGSLGFAAAAIAIIAPVGMLLVALIPVLRVVPVVVIGCLLLGPVICVLTAMLGTFRSAVWTIGYVTQVES
jgi:hypothetical protein